MQCNKYGRSCVCACIYTCIQTPKSIHHQKGRSSKRLGSQLNNTEITWQQQVVWCRASQMSPAGQMHKQKSWALLVPPWTWAVRAYMLSAAKSYHYSLNEKAIQHASWFRIASMQRRFVSRRISWKAHRAKRIGLNPRHYSNPHADQALTKMDSSHWRYKGKLTKQLARLSGFSFFSGGNSLCQRSVSATTQSFSCELKAIVVFYIWRQPTYETIRALF